MATSTLAVVLLNHDRVWRLRDTDDTSMTSMTDGPHHDHDCMSLLMVYVIKNTSLTTFLSFRIHIHSS